jgi:hypothetical protein
MVRQQQDANGRVVFGPERTSEDQPLRGVGRRHPDIEEYYIGSGTSHQVG